jgi:hypothetical protein
VSCTGCAQKDAIIAQLHGELAGKRRKIAKLERDLAETRGEGEVPDLLAPHVHEIGAYWRDRCGHERAKIDGRRYRAVRARLVEGARASKATTPEARLEEAKAEIREAIDGAAAAPNVNERTGERYDDLELICRNQSKLDSFRARAPKSSADDIRSKLIGGA